MVIQFNAQMTDAEYNLILLTPARRTLIPELEQNVAQASASSSSSSDSEALQSDSDDSMTSTELRDMLHQTNRELHTSDDITAPLSMLKYIGVIVNRFHVTSQHPDYNGDTSLSNYMIYTSFHKNPSADRKSTV